MKIHDGAAGLRQEIEELKPLVKWGMELNSRRYLPLAEKLERLEALHSKIERGERLNNQERLERQGLIFNHSGKCGKIIR